MRVRQYKDSAKLIVFGAIGIISTIVVYLVMYYFS